MNYTLTIDLTEKQEDRLIDIAQRRGLGRENPRTGKMSKKERKFFIKAGMYYAVEAALINGDT